MYHHTKTKGDLGNLKAKTRFCELGYLVLSPESEHTPFDFVVYKDSFFPKVQVKYREKKNGKIQIAFKSCWADKNGTHEKPWDLDEIDILCIYCKDNDTCYFIRPDDFSKSVKIQIDEPKSNSGPKANKATNFLVP